MVEIASNLCQGAGHLDGNFEFAYFTWPFCDHDRFWRKWTLAQKLFLFGMVYYGEIGAGEGLYSVYFYFLLGMIFDLGTVPTYENTSIFFCHTRELHWSTGLLPFDEDRLEFNNQSATNGMHIQDGGQLLSKNLFSWTWKRWTERLCVL